MAIYRASYAVLQHVHTPWTRSTFETFAASCHGCSCRTHMQVAVICIFHPYKHLYIPSLAKQPGGSTHCGTSRLSGNVFVVAPLEPLRRNPCRGLTRRVTVPSPTCFEGWCVVNRVMPMSHRHVRYSFAWLREVAVRLKRAASREPVSLRYRRCPAGRRTCTARCTRRTPRSR